MKKLILNKLLAFIALFVGIFSLCAGAAFARIPVLVSGSVTFSNYVQLSSVTNGPLTSIGYSEDVTFAGDISGAGKLIGKFIAFPDGSNVAVETIRVDKGTILGKKGTFHEQDDGAVNVDGTYLIRGTIDGAGGLGDTNAVLQFNGNVNTGVATYQGFVRFDN